MDNNDKNNENINITISAGDNKIKYYESTDNNCIFEILEDNQSDNRENIITQKATIVDTQKSTFNDSVVKESKTFKSKDYVIEDTDLYGHNNEEKTNYGEITATSILDCGEKEYLQGVKINLYKINGLSPVLIDSQITDEQGNVTFNRVGDGCYRIIEIIDKRYFEKPKYVKWNEITIDYNNKNHKLVIVNRIKRFAARNKYN